MSNPDDRKDFGHYVAPAILRQDGNLPNYTTLDHVAYKCEQAQAELENGTDGTLRAAVQDLIIAVAYLSDYLRHLRDNEPDAADLVHR